ncbi:MAG: hypothetical protein K8S16_13350 [Bacteroidales bacterium]|nr:hypothetical protein [Bacteroidales bacterium]
MDKLVDVDTIDDIKLLRTPIYNHYMKLSGLGSAPQNSRKTRGKFAFS